MATNTLLPGIFVDINAQRANTATGDIGKVLLVGQGANPSSDIQPVASAGGAVTDYGQGSPLALMASRVFAAFPRAEVYALSLADGTSASARTYATVVGTEQGASAATASGTYTVNIGEQSFDVGVAVSDTPETVAANIVSAVSENDYVGAGASAATATFTARTAGVWANTISISIEGTVPGLALAHTNTPGVTDADWANGFTEAVIGDEQYDFIVLQDSTAAGLNAVQTQMERRWGRTVGAFGVCFAANKDTFADNLAFINGRNNRYESILTVEDSVRAPNCEVAAAYAGVAARALQEDVSRPLATLSLPRISAGLNNRYTNGNKEALLQAGASVVSYSVNGNAIIGRATTSYRENALGERDNSYIPINVPYQLIVTARTFRARLSSRFARSALYTNPAAQRPVGSTAATIPLIRAEAVAIYGDLRDRGVVENVEAFSQAVSVVLPPEGDTVQLGLNPDLLNQLQIFNVSLDFIR